MSCFYYLVGLGVANSDERTLKLEVTVDGAWDDLAHNRLDEINYCPRV
jgi:hypothetical protein